MAKEYKKTSCQYRTFLEIIFCSPIGGFLVDLIISSNGYNNNCHNTIFFFYRVDNTDADSTKFDFEKPGKVCSIFVTEGFAIAALID